MESSYRDALGRDKHSLSEQRWRVEWGGARRAVRALHYLPSRCHISCALMAMSVIAVYRRRLLYLRLQMCKDAVCHSSNAHSHMVSCAALCPFPLTFPTPHITPKEQHKSLSSTIPSTSHSRCTPAFHLAAHTENQPHSSYPHHHCCFQTTKHPTLPHPATLVPTLSTSIPLVD